MRQLLDSDEPLTFVQNARPLQRGLRPVPEQAIHLRPVPEEAAHLSSVPEQEAHPREDARCKDPASANAGFVSLIQSPCPASLGLMLGVTMNRSGGIPMCFLDCLGPGL